jgi:beta-mannosidase
LEVVNEHDEIGSSLFFRVNGIDIFAKGANWIPCDALPSRMTAEKYEDRLSSAAKVGMNTIRLWGGGQYEADAFYDACDRMGLVIWHDLPFSCSTYPSSPEFLDLVIPELRHQLRRLASRPSIVMWCGDNECIGALTWFPETTANRSLYTTNYDRLSRQVTAIVREEDPSRTFWPSSPCGGPSLADVWLDNWHSDGKGDMHMWQVWHENLPFSRYLEINPRFCSEFGFQSFPSITTIATFCPPEERNPYSNIMEFHQKNEGGNGRIMSTIALYFRFPEFGLPSIVYLSQLQQAIAMKTAVEYWRSLRPVCMGTLYWQLNDMYPVQSWSSLEASGRWKMIHYFARSFYANICVIALPGHETKRRKAARGANDAATEDVEIWAMNDTAGPVSISVNVELWDLPKSKLLRTITLTRTLPRLSSEMLAVYYVAEFCESEIERQTRFLHISLSRSTTSASQPRKSFNNYFFAAYKHLTLPKAGKISPNVAAGEGTTFFVKVSSPVILVHMFLLVEDFEGEFEGPNGDCVVLPGREHETVFVPKRRLSLDEFKDKLSVTHLRETYV